MNNTTFTDGPMKSIEEKLFDVGMDMSWALFDCPWQYLSPFQKFTVKLTVAVLYTVGWVNGRFSKFHKTL
jgi:hypothetical protein